ncbi:MAG: Cof-type HAD-IIB family hydrolase [Bacilli bacterium]
MKVIVCDLDGTLIGHDHKIDQSSLEKISQFCKDGNLFLVATGRLDADITFVEQKLGFKGKYRISQNGCVVRNEHGETVFNRTIHTETKKELAELLFAENVRVEVNTESNRHFPTPRPGNEVSEFIDSSIIVDDLKAHTQMELDPTIFLMFGTEQEFQPIIKRVSEKHSEHVIAVMTSPSSLEIFNKEASKGLAIEFVMNKLGITADDVYVVGDSENDMSMFTVTKHSFCMAHGKEHVRNAANYAVKTVGEVVDHIMKEQTS